MVVVCTVSFNSSVIIEKTIDAVLSQSFNVDKIVIADNNSSEEHKNRLESYREKSDKIEIIRLETNTGGAGGFHAAMQYARDHYDPDWYWLMDDDAYPNENCLEILMNKTGTLKNVGYVAPIIWGIDKKQYQLYHIRKKQGMVYRFQPIAKDYNSLNEVEEIDVDAFVGPLFRKEAVLSCGLPNEGYFIEGDDTDYTFRITRNYKGYLIKEAVINHKDLVVGNGINPEGWWKQYYWFRNSILFYINNLSGMKKTVSIGYFLYFGFKEIVKTLLDKKYNGYKLFRVKLLRQGLSDGLRGKTGIMLKPAEYKELLKDYRKRKGIENA